jgi:hypothetical protein
MARLLAPALDAVRAELGRPPPRPAARWVAPTLASLGTRVVGRVAPAPLIEEPAPVVELVEPTAPVELPAPVVEPTAPPRVAARSRSRCFGPRWPCPSSSWPRHALMSPRPTQRPPRLRGPPGSRGRPRRRRAGRRPSPRPPGSRGRPRRRRSGGPDPRTEVTIVADQTDDGRRDELIDEATRERMTGGADEAASWSAALAGRQAGEQPKKGEGKSRLPFTRRQARPPLPP